MNNEQTCGSEASARQQQQEQNAWTRFDEKSDDGHGTRHHFWLVKRE